MLFGDEHVRRYEETDGVEGHDWQEGVPTLVANQEPANYVLNEHAASDTFDKVDIPALKRNAAIAAGEKSASSTTTAWFPNPAD